jgi:hypothetical protein
MQAFEGKVDYAQLVSDIIHFQTEIDAYKAKIASTEGEIDRLFPDGPTPVGTSTNGTQNGSFIAALAAEVKDFAPIEQGHRQSFRLSLENLGEQVLAVLKANPLCKFSGDALTTALNEMSGRSTPAMVDSVNAALSRLTSEGAIIRVERGMYQAKRINGQ